LWQQEAKKNQDRGNRNKKRSEGRRNVAVAHFFWLLLLEVKESTKEDEGEKESRRASLSMKGADSVRWQRFAEMKK
jgi:hypothetical protein